MLAAGPRQKKKMPREELNRWSWLSVRGTI
jgi:hypothetical protein